MLNPFARPLVAASAVFAESAARAPVRRLATRAAGLGWALAVLALFAGGRLSAQEGPAAVAPAETPSAPVEPASGTESVEEPTAAPASGNGERVEATPVPITSELVAARPRVMVIPVRDEVAKPALYVLRRGLKTAIEQQADFVVLDMKTPGGSLGVTFEILEALAKFKGDTATFVNDEAISAGSFIAAMTDEIYFAPTGVIGAAAPVMSGGGEIDESMKLKIVSYLKARIRSISEGHGYRGQVISAMIDSDYELKIGDEVLKPKGELLSLTASEASKTYGDPAQPLLAAGIFDSVDALLAARYGDRPYTVERLEPTWSEDLAAVLNSFAPLLLGLGFLGLFIEFKTPGFGLFGIVGGICLVIVFLGHYVAGLSGHEPMLFFALGVVLVLVELLFFPGVIVMALSGVLMMLGAVVWSMADLWPNEPIVFSSGVFMQPIINLTVGLGVAIVGLALVLRFLPRGWFWDRMVLATAVGDDAGPAGFARIDPRVDTPLIGRMGVAVTGMYPSGQVEIDGRRYEAQLQVGSLEPGQRVVVRAEQSFGLLVEPAAEGNR